MAGPPPGARLRTVGPWVKLLVLLAVTLPIVAYVAGTLSAAPQQHAPRSPVILRDAEPSGSPDPTNERRRGDQEGTQPRDDTDDGPRDDDNDDDPDPSEGGAPDPTD